MELLQLVAVDLLQAYAWPIFFAVIILIFRKQLIRIGVFVGNLISEKEIGSRHQGTSFRIDPPGTQEKDISPPEQGQEVSSAGRINEEGGQVEFGWLRAGGDVVGVADEVAVSRNPDRRSLAPQIFQIGQRHYFAVVNGSSEPLVFPLCSIEFPSQFRHLDTEHPVTGIRTINSDLWGMSGRLTELKDISLSRTVISSVLARVLEPGQFLRFFIRFDLPDISNTYNLVMKLEAEGLDEMTRVLTLRVEA